MSARAAHQFVLTCRNDPALETHVARRTSVLRCRSRPMKCPIRVSSKVQERIYVIAQGRRFVKQTA